MLLPTFQWLESLWIGKAVVNSLWLFPVIESVHLLALSVLGGSILLVDLRMLGFGLKQYSVAALAREARPFLIGAIVMLISTGLPLFLAEAIKCYYSPAFWVKMSTLAVAIMYTFTIRARVTRSESVHNTARQLAGALSIALWITVAAAGRWIGFS
jgi:hypothetical protein